MTEGFETGTPGRPMKAVFRCYDWLKRYTTSSDRGIPVPLPVPSSIFFWNTQGGRRGRFVYEVEAAETPAVSEVHWQCHCGTEEGQADSVTP